MGNKDLKKSIVFFIVGFVLVVSAVILSVFNEIYPSEADAVKSAKELTDTNAAELDGGAVWVKGNLHSENRATDTDYIYVSDCVVLRRYVEIYNKYETKHYDSDNNYQNTTVEYRWEFHKLTIIAANDLKIGSYNIAVNTDMEFADMPLLDLSGHVKAGHSLYNNLVYPNNNSGSASVPREYDIRISYRFLKNEAEGIVVGRLNGNEIINLVYGVPKISVYKYFNNNSIDAVISSLETKKQVVLWILRVVGFLLFCTSLLFVWLGFKAAESDGREKIDAASQGA